MGMFTAIFICSYIFYDRKLFYNKNFLLGLFFFLLIISPLIYSIFFKASVSNGTIPVDKWIKVTKIFSSHWYPVTMEMFTKRAIYYFFPFLLSILFFIVSSRHIRFENEKNKKILVGLFTCLVLSIIGIVLSEFFQVPILIKISFQRMSGFFTFFSTLYYINYLYIKLNNSNLFIHLVSLYSILLLFFSSPGLAILPLILLFYSDVNDGYAGFFRINLKIQKRLKLFIYIVIVLIAFIVLINNLHHKHEIFSYLHKSLWSPFQYLNPLEYFDFLLWGGGH
jgi:cell division protein FtsL